MLLQTENLIYQLLNIYIYIDTVVKESRQVVFYSIKQKQFNTLNKAALLKY